MSWRSIFAVSLLIGHVLCGQLALMGQEVQSGTVPSDVYRGPGTAFYLEVAGKGVYSVNIDFRTNESKAFSVGGYITEEVLVPSLMVYRFRGKKYRTEIGGGWSLIFTQEDGLVGLLLHGVYGYRYQKKDGLLLRIGFTPFLILPVRGECKFLIIPWAGFSLGFSS